MKVKCITLKDWDFEKKMFTEEGGNMSNFLTLNKIYNVIEHNETYLFINDDKGTMQSFLKQRFRIVIKPININVL